MFQEIEMPDGTVLEFPVDMSDSDIQNALKLYRVEMAKAGTLEVSPESRRRHDEANAAATENMRDAAGWAYRLGDNVLGYDDGYMSPGEKLGTALNMGGEAMTLGVVGDEAAAGLDAMLGGDYDKRLGHYRGNEAEMWREHPALSFGTQIAPALLPGMGAAGAVARIGSIPGRVGAGAVLGGAAGGTYGFMEGEGGAGNRMKSGKDNALLAALVGGAIPAVGAGVRGVTNKIKKNRAVSDFIKGAPDEASLYKASKDAFKLADESAPLSRSAYVDWADEIAEAARKKGLRGTNAPAANTAMQEIIAESNLAKSPGITFGKMDELRNLASGAAKKVTDQHEQSLGIMIRDAIDDFVDTSPSTGAAARKGRDLWRRLRNSELVTDAMKEAELAGSGFENGLRNAFRSILKKDIKRNRLPADLKAAMKEVVDGTTAGNWLRRVARMSSMGSGSHTNMLGAGLSAGGGATVGSAIGGVPGAMIGGVLPSIIGAGASRGATNTTVKAAEKALAIARAGGGPRLPAPVQNTPGLLELLMLSGATPAIQ